METNVGGAVRLSIGETAVATGEVHMIRLMGIGTPTVETLVVACWSCNSRRGAGEVLELPGPHCA